MHLFHCAPGKILQRFFVNEQIGGKEVRPPLDSGGQEQGLVPDEVTVLLPIQNGVSQLVGHHKHQFIFIQAAAQENIAVVFQKHVAACVLAVSDLI